MCRAGFQLGARRIVIESHELSGNMTVMSPSLRCVTVVSIFACVAACSDDSLSGGSGGSGAAGGSGGAGGSGAGSSEGAGGSGGPDQVGGGGGGEEGGGGGGLGGGLPGGPSSSRLTLRPVGTVEGATIGYSEYLPPGYGDGALRPLLVFHHGIGESGNGSEEELARLYNTGLPTLLKNDQWPEDRPFIVLSTQHDAPPNTSCHSVAEIHDFLDFAKDHYDVDPSRIYITGLSCGAIGSWNYLGAHTNEVVAGAVLIAGNGNDAFGQAGCDLGSVPIWAFHGDADGTVNVSGSVNPINALNQCQPPPVDAELTVYPGVGHNSWDMTYNLSAGHDIYAWFLSH